MDLMNLVNIAVLIVVVYVALRVGAVLMKLLLGLVAIGLLVWLLVGLFGGAPVGASAAPAPWQDIRLPHAGAAPGTLTCGFS